ncbi:MAG: DoxX family protein [Deltaproteobacteria bacterium]|nr:DoxX family protein [Deltaproteobacteria bacterium]TLN05223.1 MAG: DoxX family protein [bacterium]
MRNITQQHLIEANVQSGLNTYSKWSYHLLRIALGGIFIYSGAIKLLDVKGFARMISLYDLVPEQMLAAVAIGLPSLELVAGIGLLFEIPGALSAIFAMLLMFCTILWYAILQDLDIDCGCFSTEELKGQNSLRQALYRDFVMIAVCCFLYYYRFLRTRREQGSAPRLKFTTII